MDAVGPYRILGVLGSGGMGTVYRALAPGSGDEVAVKVLRKDLERGRPELTERFVREVQAAQALRHPAIVQVLDHGRDDDGTLYIVMELCRGEDLAKRLERGPMSVAEACGIAATVAYALAHAHARGVVHRDLKPANVFLCPAGPKLLDFGVARLATTTAKLTVGNVILGTPEYMAPEQARNEPDVDGRADLYSLGAIVFEALTGVPPFTGDGPLAVLVRVLTEPVRPVSSLRVDVPPDVDALVSSLLVKERDRRRSDAAIVAAELREMAQRVSRTSQPRRDTSPSIDMADIAKPQAPGGRPEAAEMRIVTVLAALDLEDPAPLDAAARAGGGVVEVLGDGQALAVFGAELSFGDEPARALRVALGARGSAAPTRIGVATGRARASTGGEVAGTVVGQAVRLAETAAAGTIRICPATAEAARGLFSTERMPDGSFDLSSERPGGVAVRAFHTTFVGRDREIGRILGLFARAVMDGEPQTVIVTGVAGIGKTRLKDELRASIESRAGKVSTLEARGDPLRKDVPYSTVADALRTRIRPGAQSFGDNVGDLVRDTLPERDLRASVATLVPGFFGPNRIDADMAPTQKSEVRRAAVRSASSADLLPHLARYLDRLGQPSRDAEAIGLAMGIGRPAATGSGARELRSRMEDALVSTLVAEARAAPTVFTVEDMQWVDVDSLAVLERAIREARGLPLTLLALARPELLDEAPALFARARRTVVRLGPLDPGAARALIREVLRARPEVGESAELVAHIEAQGAGNPLYLQELATCAMPGSSLVPMSVENALQSHFDQLAHTEREVCKRAAVMGLSFWDAALPALGAEPAEAARALARLSTLELVLLRSSSRFEGASEYGFSHALLREAAYGRLPEEQKAPMHLAFARWLEEAGEPDAAVLAHHWALGGEAERAGRCLVRAAEGALAAFANEAAVAHAGAALALAAEPSVRHGALSAREEALHRLGRRAEQERDVAQLEAESATDDSLVLALSRRARLHRARGSPQDAAACLERAIALPPAAADPAVRTDLQHQLGDVLYSTGRAAEAIELARKAVAAAESRSDGPTGPLARALWLRARAAAALGSLGPALSDHARALALFEESDDRGSLSPCLSSAARVEILAGQPEVAAETARRARAIASTARDPAAEAEAEELGSLALSAQGRGGEARIAAMKAIDLAERVGSVARRAAALVALARAEAALGSAEAVIDAATEALEIGGEHDLHDVGIKARVELARALLACGEIPRATQVSEEALAQRLAPGGGSSRSADADDELYLVLARTRIAAGDGRGAATAARCAVDVVSSRARSLPPAGPRERYLASAPAANVVRIARDLGIPVTLEALTDVQPRG